MKLEAIELYRLDLALQGPVGTAAGEHRRRPVAFVKVVTDAAVGWGECAALSGGTAVDPPLAAVWEQLAGPAARRLVTSARARGGHVPPAAQVARLFDASPPGRMAAAALEMAVLDAELRAGRATASLAGRLGVPPAGDGGRVPVGAMVGIPADRRAEAVVEAVAAAVSGGAVRVRIKIEPGWDVVPVRAVRAAYPDLLLQADANGSYRLGSEGDDAAERLSALDGAGLACIEQPLPPADLPALARLSRRLGTPVCLDESLTSLRRVTDALRAGACQVACLKPGRLGGLLAARRAQQACRDAGAGAFVGGFFETGFARSAHAALAGLPGFTLPGDLSHPDGYLDANPVAYPPTAGGSVRPYGGPGIAPPPAPGALAGAGAAVVVPAGR
ncbi:MAG: enolase C-terminal domain-like protein [Acidimicrobiales bacterium]